MNRNSRLKELEGEVKPEKVFLVSWRGERFTKGAGEEISKAEFEQLRSLPGAYVTHLPFNCPELF